ncbi:MAG: 50S ribosomal protein L25 [Candidatus Zixiibacteriota bacterium]|nr:MAG: 50S ribosomal protein L25 [candidate division Zixibacteria bacterium]
MQEIKLTAEKRDGVGKGVARQARMKGYIPGVVYGPETKSFPITMKTTDVEAFLRQHGKSNMLIDLDVAGMPGERKVLIRELQRDPVRGTPRHIDLYQVSMKKKINLSIAVDLVGTPEGVKLGGILQQVIRELDIACLPTDIPGSVTVDVSSLQIGDSIHVSDISIGKVDILTNPKRTMVTVVPPTVIKVEEPAAVEEVEAEVVAEGEAEVEAAPEGEAEGDDKAKDKGKDKAKDKDRKGE